jgi:hypothetical protein
MRLNAARPALHELLGRQLPAPPAALRRGPFRAGNPPPPHDARTARLLGTVTGVAVLACLVGGDQSPAPASGELAGAAVPAGAAHQFSQGLHVLSEAAAVPLVLAKRRVVFPWLFTWPRPGDLRQAAERLLLVPLVAGAAAVHVAAKPSSGRATPPAVGLAQDEPARLAPASPPPDGPGSLLAPLATAAERLLRWLGRRDDRWARVPPSPPGCRSASGGGADVRVP